MIKYSTVIMIKVLNMAKSHGKMIFSLSLYFHPKWIPILEKLIKIIIPQIFIFQRLNNNKANKILLKTYYDGFWIKRKLHQNEYNIVELLVLPTGGALVAFAVRTNSLVNENVDKHATKSSILFYGIRRR